MKDVTTVLRDADPAADDKGLTSAEIDIMRRLVVDAAQKRDVVRTPWHHPLAVVTMVVLTLAAGVVAGLRLPQRDPTASPSPAVVPADPGERRQLQFSTPGGTRIIWVFDPEFELKESVP
jgi:hypothetical protein